MEGFRLTPQQLTEQLSKVRRLVEPRTLTSWRTKGLLPKLKGRGRGRGPGRMQYWDDPRVVDQAIILFDIMGAKRRSDYASWVLWFCGFAVDPELVRKYWIKIIKRERLVRIAEPGEFIADKYADEIDRLEIGLSTLEHFDDQTAPPIAREAIVAANEPPNIPFVREEFGQLFDAAQKLLPRLVRDVQGITSITPKSFANLLSLYRQFASNVSLQKKLEEISADELRRAQTYLRAVGSLIRAIASLYPEITESQILELRKQFGPIFGRIIFEAILLIMNSGQEEILASSRSIISRIADGLNSAATIPEIQSQTQSDFSELYNKFSHLDWKRMI